jgi:hypothetical protein
MHCILSVINWFFKFLLSFLTYRPVFILVSGAIHRQWGNKHFVRPEENYNLTTHINPTLSSLLINNIS